ncbi:MAG: tetratricopeptide repeat protein [Gemmataceae bacterium]|nr:tetratricopeptide repeat protein [Gemmata sp.]MDW8198102.1 tetratricopeptide repeat protein [Gemmataceae bacterium]
MMNLLQPLIPLALLWTAAPVDYPALKQRLYRGNYAEAVAGFEELTRGADPPAAAFAGLAACRQAVGEYRQALAALDAGLKRYPGNAELLAQRADLLYSLGRWEEAIRDAEAALQTAADHVLARWVRARIRRDQGDLAAADTEMRWFVRTYTEAAAAHKEIRDPAQLLIIAQAGVENATTHNKPDQIKFVLHEVLRDAIRYDPDFWPAEAYAGRLLWEKHNRAEAANAFDAALKINPKAGDALVGKGWLALARMDGAEAERQADLALKINPQHTGALRLKADVRLAEADRAAAEKLLQAARAVNPREEATLARLAALRQLADDDAGFAAIVKEVLAFDSKPAEFYTVLGSIFSEARMYARAAECFEKAIAYRPTQPAAKAGLGLLYYTQGREAEALATLRAARQVDPFNVKVDNAIRVLEELATYATLETPHFVIRFDQNNDGLLANFLADVLEETFAEFSRLYGFTPAEKIIVEIFARRQMFSGRIAMLPGLPGAVQGACTGPLIALPSPRADGGQRLYNWAIVARHELTHAFNLLQTAHRVPTWLTEGLAVRAEQTQRLEHVRPILRDRLAAGTALNLETITRAYKRFTQPTDIALAYYQGWLYVEYIIHTYGERGIAQLLAAFQKTADVATALQQALGVQPADFERGYQQYVAKLLPTARPAEKTLSFAELEAAHRQNPHDLDIAARLAAEYVRRDKTEAANKLLAAIREKDKTHPLACVVQARLLRRAQDDDAALALLQDAVQAHPHDGRVLAELGKLHFDRKDYTQAATIFEQGRRFAPEDADWLDWLSRVYDLAQKPQLLAAVLAERVKAAPDDFALHIRLAKLYVNAAQYPEAERIARAALYIDLTSRDARELLLTALMAQKKTAAAEQLRKRYSR